MVDVVPCFTDQADAGSIEDVTAVDGDIGEETAVTYKIVPLLAGGTYSVGANFVAVTSIIVACPLGQCEPLDAGGAVGARSRVTVNGSGTSSIFQIGSKGTGHALAVISGIVGEAGREILEALTVVDAEGGLTGEALICGAIEVALWHFVRVNACA